MIGTNSSRIEYFAAPSEVNVVAPPIAYIPFDPRICGKVAQAHPASHPNPDLYLGSAIATPSARWPRSVEGTVT